MFRKRLQKGFSGILCFILAMTGVIGVGSQTAKADISSLITSYKPQVVNADANVSYTDSNGNTISEPSTIRVLPCPWRIWTICAIM